MTKTIEIGDILELSTGKRMVYKGDGIASLELFYPVSNEWRTGDGAKTMPLNEQQITFWLSKKG